MPSAHPFASTPGWLPGTPSCVTSFRDSTVSKASRSMADSTSAATTAAPVPDPDAIARAEIFTRERFVHEGEDLADALAPGTGRRLALDAALAEIDAGAEVPSTQWRRRYSLLLGLERVLSEDEPRLADGTTLNPHQVDALSGTLTAVLAEAQRDSEAPRPVAAPVLAVDEEPDEEPSDDGEIDLEVEIDVDLDEDDEESEDAEPEAEAYDDDESRRGRRGRLRGARRPQRPQALLVRARDRRRQDGRRDGLRRGVAHRRHPDPHPPPQPRRPVQRRAARPRLRRPRSRRRCSTTTAARTRPSTAR